MVSQINILNGEKTLYPINNYHQFWKTQTHWDDVYDTKIKLKHLTGRENWTALRYMALWVIFVNIQWGTKVGITKKSKKERKKETVEKAIYTTAQLGSVSVFFLLLFFLGIITFVRLMQ